MLFVATVASAQDIQVLKQTFLVTPLQSNGVSPPPQLAVKIIGISGLLTPYAAIAHCTQFVVSDHTGETAYMTVDGVDVEADMARLKFDKNMPEPEGKGFKRVNDPQVGLGPYSTASSDAIEQLVSAHSFTAEVLTGRNVMLTFNPARDQSFIHLWDVRKALPFKERMRYPSDSLVIGVISFPPTERAEPMRCLVGTPVWKAAGEPVLVGLIGGNVPHGDRHWFIPVEAFRAVDDYRIPAQVAKARRVISEEWLLFFGNGQNKPIDLYDTCAFRPDYSIQLENVKDATEGEVEALKRIREHKREFDGSGRCVQRGAGGDSALCGMGRRQLEYVWEHTVGPLGGVVANAEHPRLQMMIRCYNNINCREPSKRDSILSRPRMAELIELNGMLRNLSRDELKILFQCGFRTGELEDYFAKKLILYMHTGYLRTIKLELEAIDLYNDCNDVPERMRDIQHWQATYFNAQGTASANDFLVHALAVFDSLRTVQLGRRYEGYRAQFPSASARSAAVEADTCLSTKEKLAMLDRFKEELDREVKNAQAKKVYHDVRGIAARLIAGLEAKGIDSGVNDCQIHVFSERDREVLDVLIGGNLKVPRFHRKKLTPDQMNACDTVKVFAHSYRLGGFSHPGTDAILDQLGMMLDSIWTDSTSKPVTLQIVGAADGVGFRTEPNYQAKWEEEMDRLVPGAMPNVRLALARALDARDLLERFPWIRDVVVELGQLAAPITNKPDPAMRNVRIQLYFPHDQ